MADRLVGFGKEAPALLEVMRLGALAGDADRVVDLLCEQAARLTGADYAGLRLEDENHQVEWRGMWGNRTDAWRKHRSASHRGAATEAMETGRTIVSSGQEFLARRASVNSHSVRANEGGVVEIATPLTYGDRPMGTLILGWRSEVSISDEQIGVAEALAGYGALVLENARSRLESERRRAEAEALADLARQGAANQQVEAVVDLVCRRACELVGSDFAALLMRMPDGGVDWLGVSGNRSGIWHERHHPSGRGPAATSMAEARTVVFKNQDPNADGTLDGLAVLGSEGTQTAVAVPLLRRDGPFGSLVLGWRTPQTITDRQRRLTEALGGYTAAILDNALSHAESERRRSQAEALAELVREGAGEHQIERTITLVCHHGARLVGADSASVTFVEGDHRQVYQELDGEITTRQARRRRGRGPTNRAITAGRPIVFEHIPDQDDPSPVHTQHAAVTAIAAPFAGREGLRGALHLCWRSVVPITAGQLRLAEALAGYAAVVFENARAHAALQERAETVRLANEQLTRLDEMKSNLISNVSHELRTPLTSIRAFSELLLDPAMDGGTRLEFAQIINAESERLTRLVSNLLDLSRIQSHGVSWDFRDVDLTKELERAVSALMPSAEEKRLTLRLDVPPELPSVTADADGLQQALVNLISNAIKFTSSGEVVVRAERRKGKVRVAVRDTGPGISIEDQVHIFDRFYQSGNILTAKPAGTGLGLAITKEILIQHGTDISLTSSPQGSEFSFLLPSSAPALAV
ncbi:MAG TPA: GAF domain-containing protein [Chloroflexota bacterium]|nr:GAF domain-containing protein [Chloroflexota bacterium]